MKVLLLGNGGREHALGWAIRRERPDTEVAFLPGNGGTAALGRNVPIALGDHDAILAFAREFEPAFTLVGPEAPLVGGLVDAFSAAGLPIFGPTQRAAAIEGSKIFSKSLLRTHGIPTAAFEVFSDPNEARRYLRSSLFPQVVKADGLAAGKGVLIVHGPEEGERAIEELMESRRFGGAGERILIESFLDGEEVSALALCRGEEFVLLPLARDYKRAFDDDQGPNTGGMGAVSPHPANSASLREAIGREVLQPTLHAMAREGRPFHGLLYAGIMLVHGRPQVLEFNCRFGDPETEAVLALLDGGFVDALQAIATGNGTLAAPKTLDAHATTVILASEGYPGDYRTGLAIRGLEKAAALPETFVFHAGTSASDGKTLSAGGRVLAVTGRGPDPRAARSRAYDAASAIEFEGKSYRRDIGRFEAHPAR